MRSLSTIGLALSIVFGCLVLALLAELYYLLWWKKRKITKREVEEDYSSFCWKSKPSLSSRALNTQEHSASLRIRDSLVNDPEAQLPAFPNKDFWSNSIEDDELMRLQDLQGPPRFLFTIREETREDLESEEGKSRGEKSRKSSKSRSLSDLALAGETPFLTPIASPPYLTPPLTPFRPSFELTEVEFNRVRASPPPKLKFLKDAEDKLYRRRLMEEEKKKGPSTPVLFSKDEENGSFISLVAKNRGRDGGSRKPTSQIELHQLN
ncbi:hypothetical protein NMG60_11012476 [Bertholletia excelsa]